MKKRTTAPLAEPAFRTPEAARLWREINDGWCLDVHQVELLRQLCDTTDRIAECKQLVDQHGAVYVDRFQQVKSNPALLAERDLRALAVKLTRELCLGERDPQPSKPPSLPGRYR